MRKLVLISIVVLGFISLQVQAQNNQAFRHADKLYHKFAYADAVKAYQKAYRKYPADSVRIRIATCYNKLNQPEEVAAWYAKVQQTDQLSVNDYLALGSALESLGTYDEALACYQKCAVANPQDSRMAYKIKGIEQLESYLKDSALYEIRLLNINTEAYDFAPAFFEQGIAFVSSRERMGSVNRSFQWDHTPFLDIYYAQEYRQGRFYPPVPFNSKVNSWMHEGAMAFNRDFTRIVFTRNNYSGIRKGRSDEKVTKLKMYWGEREKQDNNSEDFAWANIQEFPYNSDQYSVGDPAVNPDFTRIIFASDMPGGKGGTDLYESIFRNGNWSEPRNLGETFNTEGDERFPSLDENGNLYFASDGRDGLGGLDIYLATPNEQGYTISNMGYPVNSRKDDFGLILDAKSKKGYFSSNREGGVGMDDIYAFTIKEKPKEEKPEARLEVCFEVRNKDTDSTLANAQVYMMNVASKAVRSFVTNAHGQVCTELKPNMQYIVKASKPRHLSDGMQIYTRDSLTGKLQAARPLLLEPLKVEQKFRYEEVFFDRDDFSIRPDAAEELDKIVSFIKAHPGITVELSAHTDSRGTNMYNEALSLKRAQSSREYIISQRVDPDAITAKGYGEYMLTNNCDDGVPCSEEEHQQNRRTEIKITGIRKLNPEQEGRMQSSQSGLDPTQDYSKTYEEVQLVPLAKTISVK